MPTRFCLRSRSGRGPTRGPGRSCGRGPRWSGAWGRPPRGRGPRCWFWTRNSSSSGGIRFPYCGCSLMTGLPPARGCWGLWCGARGGLGGPPLPRRGQSRSPGLPGRWGRGPPGPFPQAGFACGCFAGGQRRAPPWSSFCWPRRIGGGPSGRSERNGRCDGTRAWGSESGLGALRAVRLIGFIRRPESYHDDRAQDREPLTRSLSSFPSPRPWARA